MKAAFMLKPVITEDVDAITDWVSSISRCARAISPSSSDRTADILSSADLTVANLTNANLANANLANANLYRAILTNASSGGIAGTPSVLPVSWQLINGYLIGPKANLANAVLDDADLQGAILTEANLTNATLNRTNLYDASLAGANLTGVSNASLAYSILTGANLTNAQFASPPVYVTSGGITGVPSALPSG
jgi:uncharacterized protein YjbI with pentapeptide repeats